MMSSSERCHRVVTATLPARCMGSIARAGLQSIARALTYRPTDLPTDRRTSSAPICHGGELRVLERNLEREKGTP